MSTAVLSQALSLQIGNLVNDRLIEAQSQAKGDAMWTRDSEAFERFKADLVAQVQQEVEQRLAAYEAQLREEMVAEVRAQLEARFSPGKGAEVEENGLRVVRFSPGQELKDPRPAEERLAALEQLHEDTKHYRFNIPDEALRRENLY